MPTSEQREENKERVLQAAIWCFANMGIENTSRMSIAKRAGLTERSVQRYFGNLENLIVEAMKTFMRDYTERFYRHYEQNTPASATGLEQLESFLRTHATFAEGNEVSIALLAHEIELYFIKNKISFDCVGNKIYNQKTKKYLILELIQKGIEDGSIKKSIDLEMIQTHLITTFPGMLIRIAMIKNSDSDLSGVLAPRTLIDQYITILNHVIKA